MTRKTSIVSGAALVLIGGLTLAYNLLAPRFALPVPETWRLWPLVITALGLLFLLPPVLAPRDRGLAALYVPGVPILISGGLATLTLILPAGFVWATFWPQIVLGIALGLGLAAYGLRAVWLIIPAALFGGLGAALQFTALTSWWSAWSVLWLILPFAVGAALFAIGLLRGSLGLRLAGLIVGGVTVVGALGLSALLTGNWGVINAAGALLLIGIGAALAGLNWKPRPQAVDQAQ